MPRLARSYSHTSPKLDKYLGQYVKITLRSKRTVKGVIGRFGWRYGMDICKYYNKNGEFERDIRNYRFCQSHVLRIEPAKEDCA